MTSFLRLRKRNVGVHQGDAPEWSLDVSSLMVLISEQEEVNYRLMRREFWECIAGAPVVGIQGYLMSAQRLVDQIGISYNGIDSPKSAPLRNMKSARSIEVSKLLQDGQCLHINVDPLYDGKHESIDWLSTLYVASSWAIFCGLLLFSLIMEGTSWLGTANVAVLVGWSTVLRVCEWIYLTPAKLRTSSRDKLDRVLFLGRRNSCLVVEGRRDSVSRWTGQGIAYLDKKWARLLEGICRLVTGLVLVFVFASIPNGTLYDQVVFTAINFFGQINLLVMTKLNARRERARYNVKERVPAESRTHVYGWLLRTFGDGEWVDEAGMIPKSNEWHQWRHTMTNSHEIDPKEAWDKINKIP